MNLDGNTFITDDGLGDSQYSQWQLARVFETELQADFLS